MEQSWKNTDYEREKDESLFGNGIEEYRGSEAALVRGRHNWTSAKQLSNFRVELGASRKRRVNSSSSENEESLESETVPPEKMAKVEKQRGEQSLKEDVWEDDSLCTQWKSTICPRFKVGPSSLQGLVPGVKLLNTRST